MNEREFYDKPKVGKAILCALLCLVVFSLIQILSSLLILLIGAVISVIPLIGKIFNFLFEVLRNESPLAFATITSVFISYYTTSFVQNKLMSDSSTKKVSRRILGIIILVLHILSLITNIMYDGNIFANIACILAGLAFIFSNE